jgi:hypothetical protein
MRLFNIHLFYYFQVHKNSNKDKPSLEIQKSITSEESENEDFLAPSFIQCPKQILFLKNKEVLNLEARFIASPSPSVHFYSFS